LYQRLLEDCLEHESLAGQKATAQLVAYTTALSKLISFKIKCAFGFIPEAKNDLH
jgi:hypothetical protein